jgi:hypothetical protein
MGIVSDYLSNLIAKQLDDYGLDVWYGPDGVYAEAVREGVRAERIVGGRRF